MNVEYERCLGCELFTKDGRRILDFLSGYCVHNAGHNHPYIIQALKDEMDKCGPAMLQSHVAEIAGELARRLCELAGGGSGKSLLRQQRQRRRRGGDQICPRHHRPRGHCFCQKQFSRTDCRRTLADERCILARRIRSAVARHAWASLSAILRRWKRARRASSTLRLSSSQFRPKAGFEFPRAEYLKQAQEAVPPHRHAFRPRRSADGNVPHRNFSGRTSV